MKRKYSIKEVAEIFNISTNKIRFYEKKGLINPIRNEESNYRLFNEEDVVKIQTILMYRVLGLSIDDIKDIIVNNERNNVLDHFYKQWKVLNDDMQKMRLIKDSLEEIMDLIYEDNNKNYHEGIIKCAKKMNKIQNMKDNWKDRWNFDSWASGYDKSIKSNIGGLKFYKNYDKHLDTVYEETIKKNNKDIKILDIGVGTGNLSKRFLENGYDITGLDQSREMLNVSKEKFPNLKLRLGEFLKIPFENNTFDSIVSTYAFHHLNEDEKILAIDEMLRILKDDGQIIIGDLMFENEEKKIKLINEFTEQQKIEIEDEYFSNIDFLEKVFNSKGKKLEYIKIDDLIYVIKGY